MQAQQATLTTETILLDKFHANSYSRITIVILYSLLIY